MRHRFKTADQRGQAARRQEERVAAGNNDLPNLGMLLDIGQGALEIGRGEQPLALPDLLAAEAEAAIDRADQNRLQQHPVRVAVHNAG